MILLASLASICQPLRVARRPSLPPSHGRRQTPSGPARPSAPLPALSTQASGTRLTPSPPLPSLPRPLLCLPSFPLVLPPHVPHSDLTLMSLRSYIWDLTHIHTHIHEFLHIQSYTHIHTLHSTRPPHTSTYTLIKRINLSR